MDIRAVIKQLRKSAEELDHLLHLTNGVMGRPLGRSKKPTHVDDHGRIKVREPNKRWTPEHRANFLKAMAKKRQESVKKSKKVEPKKAEA